MLLVLTAMLNPIVTAKLIMMNLCVISGFRRSVDEISALVGCYAVLRGSSVPMFRYNFSVPFLSVKKSKMRAGGLRSDMVAEL